MIINPKKINSLLSSEEIKKIFKKKSKEIGFPASEIKNVRIKVIKKYIDWRSFTLVVLYSLNKKKRIIGIANSDGKKEYAFKVNALVFKHFSGKRITPNPYCYIKPLGLFLEEFLKGSNFGEILRKDKKIKDFHIKKLAELLFLLQKTDVSKSKIKTKISFYDIKKNIKILKQRKESKQKIIEKTFEKIEKKIRGYERKNKNKVLVHGDLNPYNLFFEKDKAKIIDYTNSHIGDRVSDLANISAHFETTFDFKILKKETDSLLRAYQKIAGEFNNQEKEKFKTYKDYFNLLNISHIMVWGDNFQKTKILKKLT